MSAAPVDTGEPGDVIRLKDYPLGTIAELQRELLARLRGTGPIQLDRAGVQPASTALLQLLVAFVRDARNLSRQVEWRGVNKSFDRAARSLGLLESLGLPVEES